GLEVVFDLDFGCGEVDRRGLEDSGAVCVACRRRGRGASRPQNNLLLVQAPAGHELFEGGPCAFEVSRGELDDQSRRVGVRIGTEQHGERALASEHAPVAEPYCELARSPSRRPCFVDAIRADGPMLLKRRRRATPPSTPYLLPSMATSTAGLGLGFGD